MATLYRATDINFFLTSLVSTINSTASILVMASPVSGITAPGVIIVDLEDSNQTDTPTLREYISFTTINNQNLSGLTRGLGGSTAQSHGAGARIQAGITADHWTNLVDYLQLEHDASGRHVIGTATINYLETKNLVVTSIASIATADIQDFHIGAGFVSLVTITSMINASGASIVGFPQPNPGGLNPFMIKGTVYEDDSAAPLMIVEDAATLKSVSAILKTPASALSGASVMIGIAPYSLLNPSGAIAYCYFTKGMTYVSTASLEQTTLAKGEILALSNSPVLAGSLAGHPADLTVLIET